MCRSPPDPSPDPKIGSGSPPSIVYWPVNMPCTPSPAVSDFDLEAKTFCDSSSETQSDSELDLAWKVQLAIRSDDSAEVGGCHVEIWIVAENRVIEQVECFGPGLGRPAFPNQSILGESHVVLAVPEVPQVAIVLRCSTLGEWRLDLERRLFAWLLVAYGNTVRLNE